MEIILKKLTTDDRAYFFKWIRDKSVIRYSLSIFQRLDTNLKISQWFDTVLQDSNSLSLGIYDNNKKCLIGYAGISSINKINKSGEYFIFIGNKFYHGKGIGTFVTKEIIKIGFSELNLNRIMLTVSENNIGALNAYKKAGFIYEGCMRQAFYRDGEYSNKIIMGLLKQDMPNL